MQILDSMGSFGSSAASYVLPFIFVLTLVVFFHELGHFLVARWCGVAVKTFSVGFGPELFGYTDRQGTRWRLSVIPLGGYVKFLGDENEVGKTDREVIDNLSPEERARTFAAATVWRRALIVAAGPFANFLLAIVIFTAIFTFNGRQEMTPRVDVVVAGSPAEEAGFKPGDLIVAIDGQKIDNFSDMQRIVDPSAGVELMITIKRGDEQLLLPVTPEAKENPANFGHRGGVLGIQRNIGPGDRVTERYPLPEAAKLAVSETWFIIDRTISYLYGVVAGRESTSELGGPIRVAQIASQAASIGFVTLLSIVAYLSVSVGLINLFPVPMLDGGHLLFFGVEAARGKPLSDRAQDFGFRIGLVTVILLMIVAFGNDLKLI